jgi:hypothetical protein
MKLKKALFIQFLIDIMAMQNKAEKEIGKNKNIAISQTKEKIKELLELLKNE